MLRCVDIQRFLLVSSTCSILMKLIRLEHTWHCTCFWISRFDSPYPRLKDCVGRYVYTTVRIRFVWKAGLGVEHDRFNLFIALKIQRTSGKRYAPSIWKDQEIGMERVNVTVCRILTRRYSQHYTYIVALWGVSMFRSTSLRPCQKLGSSCLWRHIDARFDGLVLDLSCGWENQHNLN